MKDLILMKIGGSVCTGKGRNEFKAKTRTITRIADEIAQARGEAPFRLIVVNGAGPFGHSNVSEYDIDSGLSTLRDYEGFSKTITDCAYINWRVADLLRKAGLPAIPFPSSSVVMQSKKRISAMHLDTLKAYWEQNDDIIPVMNGTMVPDMKLGGSVVSGDAVLQYLAGRLRPKRVVIATDVDGIFTGDPRKSRRAKLIRGFSRDGYGDVKKHLSGSSATDVTGGMLGKVEKLLGLRTKSIIINGNVPGRTRKALLGQDVKSTVIG